MYAHANGVRLVCGVGRSRTSTHFLSLITVVFVGIGHGAHLRGASRGRTTAYFYDCEVTLSAP